MKPVVMIVKDAPDMAVCFAIRSEVFVREQFVDEAVEFDGLDDKAIHFLIKAGGAPVGTGRIRYLDGKVKIERVAIRKPHRAKGLGKALMEHIIAHIRKESKAGKMVLAAQEQAIPFYTSLKFKIIGDEYLEAGIPHRDMERAL
ncbi:MAG: GNAT family N-acetyltransferase [Rickettsiales bacterium]